MLRIAVCSEKAAYGELIEQSVKEWALQRQLNIQTRNFESGEEILADIEQTGYFDIILMDTALKGNINGMDTAERIRQIYEYFCLIFISGNKKYDKKIFELHPMRYLEKPVVKGKLFEGLDWAVDNYRFLYEIFAFRFRGVTYCIRLREVLYFASDRRVIRICMENGSEYMFYEKLDELEKKLQKYTIRFFRIHQSYLINGRQVEQHRPKSVIMRNKEMIPVSTDRRSVVETPEFKSYIYRC